MHVLCGDYYPTPRIDLMRSYPFQAEAHADVDRSDSPSGLVHLSWAEIWNFPTKIEIAVDRSDRYYRLYDDCIQHLQATYPSTASDTESAKSTIVAIAHAPALSTLLSFASFQALVNLLADVCPVPDSDSRSDIRREGIPDTFQNSMLNFILSGVLGAAPQLPDAIGGCMVSGQDTIYQNLFLDVMARTWRYECLRRATTANWSPLPWSRVSKEELSRMSQIPEHTCFETPSFSMDDFVDENGSEAFKLELVEHLRERGGTPLDIPWFGAHHDGHPFCSSLSSYTAIRRESGGVYSYRDDAALWVSAMTFGLLEAVMHVRIPESLLIVPGLLEGDAGLSGARILQLVASFILRRLKDRDVEAAAWNHRPIVHLLDRALQALDEESMLPSSALFPGGFDRNNMKGVVGSINVMVKFLRYAVSILCTARGLDDRDWESLVLEPSISLADLATLEVCVVKMRRAGWCRSAISPVFLSEISSHSADISNMAQLPPYIRFSRDEHEECTEEPEVCMFYTVTDTDAYVPRHVDPTCHCPYVKPPLDEVRALLSGGAIPVVVYDGTSLRVRPAHEVPYVAISHVWADGMGSTTEEGLPTCMVKRIAGLVRRLHPEHGAFWMDSLCVPGAGGLRKQAIRLMARTYRDAAAVLVIDDCIRSQCSESKSWTENLFRIMTSGWVRRIWTLQEGLLARKLYFEFVEGPFDFQQKWPELDDSESTISRSAYHKLPLLAFRARYPGSDASNAPPEEIVRLLHRRRTTKPEDELVAVASLFKLDISMLLEITGPHAAQRRMRTFLLQQRTVSRQLPFQGSQPRIGLPGFSWAPHSLTGGIGLPWFPPMGTAPGLCTEDGLVAEYLIAALEPPVEVPETYQNRNGLGSQNDERAAYVRIDVRCPDLDQTTTFRVLLWFKLGVPDTLCFDHLICTNDFASSLVLAIPCAAVYRTDPHVNPGSSGGINTDQGPGDRHADATTQDEPWSLNYIAPGHFEAANLEPEDFYRERDTLPTGPDLPVLRLMGLRKVLLK